MALFHSLIRKPIDWLRSHPAAARIALKCTPDVHLHLHIPEIGRLRIRLRRNRSLWLRRDPLRLERYPLAILRAIVRPTDVVWDVGGNIGLYSRWLGTHLNVGHVCTFEPMSENLPELEYNIRNGSISDRVTISPWALSDLDGEVEFQVDDVQSASGSVSSVTNGAASPGRRAIGLPPKTEIVRSRTIDSIIAARSLPPPDVLKIDVEGAERLLLEGGRMYFDAASPRLLIETHGLEVSQECIDFLLNHNYFVAVCVDETVNPRRQEILDRDFRSRIKSRFDAHYIVAAKDAEAIPLEIDASAL